MMFESWFASPDVYARRVLQVFDPPRAVLVNMAVSLPGPIGEEIATRSPPNLAVRAAGLRLETWMPGRQIAWARTSTGRFWAVVAVEAWSSNALSRLTMHLWTTPEAIVLDTPATRTERRMHEITTAPWNRPPRFSRQ